MSGPVSDILGTWGKPDVIHDNGIWLPHNHELSVQAKRSATCRIVSPRGMLSPWARRHKRIKKTVAWTLYQRRDLALASSIHATSQDEASDLRCLNLGPPVIVIPNGIDASFRAQSHRPTSRQTGSVRTALFLGRLYPVKGLPNLIEAWAAVNPDGWRLVIAGPDEGGHKSELEKQVRRLRLCNAVEFRGPVEKKEKAALFSGADLFVLPSLSESFGMAVAEAMQAGLPILTTSAVPWPDIEPKGLGWRVDETKTNLETALHQATSAPKGQLQEMGQRAAEYVNARFTWDKLTEEYIEMYQRAMSR
jgi:glycosyltransferase involved in cell wall biosynthesis